MSNVPANLKYTDQHEWLNIDGDVATIGITDYAQSSLGDLVFVELPEVGKQVKAGDSFVVVESVKAASEVYAPISGEVVEVNSSLDGAPEQINQAPYEAGWICKIKASDTSELSKLLEPAKYEELAA
ncbi:MAG: glycine cleavage system protein GcvH [Rickettsiales bacterium]